MRPLHFILFVSSIVVLVILNLDRGTLRRASAEWPIRKP